jgi:galactose mutarotase-like enzyme
MSVVAIQRGLVSARIDLAGAQLTSLCHAALERELIWQRDPAYWSDSAPNLFPIVGKLRTGSYDYAGRSYAMPKHGIVRHAPSKVGKQIAAEVRLDFSSNPTTRAHYPFDFVLEITFLLLENGLSIEYVVRNVGQTVMPASINYHPAFALDPSEGPLTRYQIQFEPVADFKRFGLKDDLMVPSPPDTASALPINLSERLFDHDALIFAHLHADRIRLLGPRSTLMTMHTGGAPHVALWSKPGAPFVCIEPWYSLPDTAESPPDLFAKPGMRAVEPGSLFRTGYQIHFG